MRVRQHTLKCLSIRQPYAHWICNPSLFVHAGIEVKEIENRDWNTQYRGPLLIHASRTFEDDALYYWSRCFPELRKAVPSHPDAYTRGAIIGIADLVDVIDDSDSDWFCGVYGFVLKNARPISPVTYRGQLGLFSVPLSVVQYAL